MYLYLSEVTYAFSAPDIDVYCPLVVASGAAGRGYSSLYILGDNRDVPTAVQKIKKNQTYLYPTPSLIPIWYRIGIASCPKAAVTEPEPLMIPVTVPKACSMQI